MNVLLVEHRFHAVIFGIFEYALGRMTRVGGWRIARSNW